MNEFHFEEKDDADSIVTIQLLTPNPKEAGKYLQMFGQSDMESSVAVFQAALKFRRPQIVRTQIKTNTSIINEYDPMDTTMYDGMDLSMHQIWELAMLSTNHKRLFASKINIIHLIISTLRTIPTLNVVNTIHIQAAAVIWALSFRPDGRNKLLKKQFDIVNVIMDALVHVGNITYKNKTIVFAADLLPSTGHIPLPYVMGYDTKPLITLSEKEKFLNEAAEREYIIFLQHDNYSECCTVQRTEKGIRLKDTFSLSEIL